MAERNADIVERVARAEKDLFDFKNAQTFGKDVTKPKVIQRFNSDGTPTEYDVVGDFYSPGGGFYEWRIGGRVTYTARNQSSPWAIVYAKIRVNPNNDYVEGGAGIYYSFNAYADLEDVFSGEKTIKFTVDGGASPIFGPPTDLSVDRYWAKIYILATDYGEMKLEFPSGQFAAGTVVPLT